jgi:2-succinyl-6-hydroxy-2,4-cyclohexadiene-1-carboxylate synthase
MLQYSKQTDERRDAGPLDCWCLHGAVGMAADWRSFGKQIASAGISTRAVDLWRFLDCCPMPLKEFGLALNAEVGGEVQRGAGRALMGYSMGGRLALHALLEKNHPWQAAVIISAHPGLESDFASRRAADTTWATQALAGDFQKFLSAWDAQALLSKAPIRQPEVASSLIMRRREIARSFVDWSLGAQEPLWDRLHEITIPVLWITGENDPKFHALAQRAVSLMPRVQHATAPASGHRVPWEAETWLAERVANFLKVGIQ